MKLPIDDEITERTLMTPVEINDWLKEQMRETHTWAFLRDVGDWLGELL